MSFTATCGLILAGPLLMPRCWRSSFVLCPNTSILLLSSTCPTCSGLTSRKLSARSMNTFLSSLSSRYFFWKSVIFCLYFTYRLSSVFLFASWSSASICFSFFVTTALVVVGS